jgi:hypothetical protein
MNVLSRLSTLSLFLFLSISLSYAQSSEKLSHLLSVPIAQLVKACQRCFCYKGLEFKSQSSQITFKFIDLIGGET